ncbi:MAG: SulP family sulfate permease [Glaciecola sp.]|jgi:SulP family sulfate permease
MNKYLPFIDWITNYRKDFLQGDLTAGLTVGVMLIPQGMAYAMLAGLPPIYGLYASTIPLIIYALFGTSRQLAVGPTAVVAIIVAEGLSELAEIGSAEFIQLAIVLALMVGVIQFLMGIFRLGFLVNYLSHPVVAGFTSAAAIIIGLSQMGYLLGLSLSRGNIISSISELLQNITSTHLMTLAIGLSAIVILLFVKKINKKIPGPLVIVLLGTGLVYLFKLNESGVSIVKDVPGGFDIFSVPNIDVDQMASLLKLALVISFVAFMESIAVAKAVHTQHKDYELRPNQEMIGLGLANIFGSFFKAFPVTGGFSRSAVNNQAGAKTGLASIISAVIIILTLLFLTDLFYFLPKAVLAAIIIVAVFGLIDIKEAKHLWKTNRPDFVLFIVTFMSTLALGIEEGILIGIGFSLIMLIYRVSYPHIAEVGRVPNTDHFRNLARFDDLEEYPDKLILRFDAQLYFANIGFLKKYIDDALSNRPEVKHLIFDTRTINYIDSSAAHFLYDLVEDLEMKNIGLHLAGVNGPVRDTLKKNDIINLLGTEHFYLSVNDAVEAIEGVKNTAFTNYATQSNK